MITIGPDGLPIRSELDKLDVPSLSYVLSEIDWQTTARDKQLAPEGDWPIWLLNAGRGFGKTLTGAQWAKSKAWTMPGSIGHVVARTSNDLRRTVFEGPAGLLNVIPQALIKTYNKGLHEMHLVNGSKIMGFSAEEPDRLRGPQCHWCWCDELAAWVYVTETWDQVIFSTRLKYVKGEGAEVIEPQILVSTTPRPLDVVKELRTRADVKVTLGSSYENRDNLAKTFFSEIIKYEGTKLGRQEIHGELIDPEEAGVVKRSWFKLWPRNKPLPEFIYIVYSLDTAFTEENYDKKTGETDFSACTVWGVFYIDSKSKTHPDKIGILMLDCWREKYGLPDLIDRVKKEAKIGYGVQTAVIPPRALIGQPAHVTQSGHMPDIMIVEDKGSGISLRQMMARENVILYPYNPGRASKLDRLHAVSHIPHAGIVYVPESDNVKRRGQFKDWTDDWFSEVCVYCGDGSTKHDDYVDSTTQAWRLIADNYLRGGVVQPPMLPEDAPAQQPYVNPYAR